MAYKKENIYKKALKAIKNENLLFIEDVVSYLPCSKTTFYNFFPDGSDELDVLKEALESNRIKTKIELRRSWKTSDNATLQIALYKTICTNDERRKLSTSYTELTGKDGGDIPVKNTVTDHRVTFEDYTANE